MAHKFAYLIFASVIVIGCGAEDPVSQRFTSDVIGVSGGALTSADGAFTVNIQPNAFDADTEVTIEIHRDSRNSNLTSWVYEVRPHDVRLNVPAELVLEMGEIKTSEDFENVHLAEVEPRVGMIDGAALDLANGRIVAQTERFSSYGALLSEICHANTDCGSSQVCDGNAGLCVNVPSPCDDGSSC